jgi:predicted transcriptional regulator
MVELSERTKKKLSDMTTSPVGSYGIMLGQRSTQYDLKEKEWWGRQWAGHTIMAERTCETAIMASGLPTTEEFKKDRMPFWYLGLKDQNRYSGLIDGYIQKAQDWNVLKIDSGIMHPSWEMKGDILDASGKYLTSSYSDRVFSHKGFQARSIVLMNHIAKTSPLMRELDSEDLGMEASQITQDLSRLEALGVVKRTQEEKADDQKFILLPIAVEVHGKEIEKKLNDAISDPFSRYIFGFIRKMPGIRFSTLLNMLGIPLEHATRIKIYMAMKMLRQSDIVVMVIDQTKDDLYLIPAWVGHLLVKNFYPTLLDSNLLKEAIRVCSLFWEIVGNVAQADNQIDTLKSHLKWVLSKKEISFKEITELGDYAKLIYSLRFVGVIEPVGRESFRVVSKNTKIMETLLQILSEAYSINIESKKFGSSDADKLLPEINAALDTITEFLSDKLSIKDAEKYQGL